MPTETEPQDAPSHTRSFLGHVISLLRDHLALADLELKYEISQLQRRGLVLAIAGLFILIAFVLLQVGLVAYGISLGYSLVKVCAVLAFGYGAVAAALVLFLGRRDPQAGEPFQGTRNELSKNLQWIQKLFS